MQEEPGERRTDGTRVYSNPAGNIDRPSEERVEDSGQVTVYDRPDRPARSGLNPVVLLVVVVVLALLAYLLYQMVF